MSQELQLPKSWVLATNNDLGEFINGFAFKPTDRSENGTPIIRIQNLTDPLRPFNYTVKNVDQKYVVELGDILVSWSATLDAFRWDGPRAYVNQHIFKVVPSKQLNDRFVFFSLKESINELTKSEHLHGTTMKHVNRKPFLAHPVGLPPLNEQHRIVEKIETLFAHIDKGEEALREVQKLLKRYRQSILKAAVTGELTRDWREANQHKLKPASDLLARILETRRKNWEGRGEYKEPVKPDLSGLADLPIGWTWATFDQLFEVLGGATPSRREPDYWGGKIRWVSSGEVAFCRIKETAQHITQAGYESCSTKVHPEGTVLVAMIGEGKTRGQAAILDTPACNNQNAAAIRVSESGIEPEFVYYFLMGRYEQSRREGQGGNQPALNGKKVKAFAMPLPSIAEMKEIVFQIEEAFSIAEAVEVTCQSELARSMSLRQSILKSAFTGQLVTQDPDDEPANELLARIRAEREATPTKKQSKKKITRRKAQAKA